MGKDNFGEIYQAAEAALGTPLTVKVSSRSDAFTEDGNFAGIIVYHHDNDFTWFNEKGIVKGFKGRAFYVLLLNTDGWPDDARKSAGQGMVHDYLHQRLFACDFRLKRTCCGGFAVMQGQRMYSSSWLNRISAVEGARPWASDNSKYLSQSEEELVDLAINAWIEHGPGHVRDIPEDLHNTLIAC